MAADKLEVELGLYSIQVGDWSEGYVLAWVGSGESENEDSDETNEVTKIRCVHNSTKFCPSPV